MKTRRRTSMRELRDLVELEPGWSLREYAERLGSDWDNMARTIQRHGGSIWEFEKRYGVHGPNWCTACSQCSPLIGIRTRWTTRQRAQRAAA